MKKNRRYNYSETVEFAKTKRFELANIGISYKTSYDWRTAGVYLEEKKTKYRMKYSPVEYIWLLLVQELREFGFPIKSVLNLKAFLMTNVNVENLLLTIQEEAKESGEYSELLEEETEVYKGSKEALQKDLREVGKNIVDSLFTSLIVGILIKNTDTILLIQKDGTCSFESGTKRNATTVSQLRVSLKRFVLSFLEKEGIEGFNHLKNPTAHFITESFDIEGTHDISDVLKQRIEDLMEECNLEKITYQTESGEKVDVSRTK